MNLKVPEHLPGAKEINKMLHEISLNDLNENACGLFSSWALAAAGEEGHWNAMTIGWGGMGVLWNKNVVTVYIRPQRYTREFMDASDKFTVNFFPPEYKDALIYFGRNSGRDTDKAAATGLEADFDSGCPVIRQARLVLECRKIYRDVLKPECFIDKGIDLEYPEKDYHIVFAGEILRVLSE